MSSIMLSYCSLWLLLFWICSWLLYCSLRVYSLALWVAYSRIDVMSSTWHKGRALWEREHKKEGVLRSKASLSGEFFENNNLVIISQPTQCTFYTTCIIIVWNIRGIPIIWTGAQAWGILNTNMNTLLRNVLKWVQMGYMTHWKVVECLGMETRVRIKAIEAEGREVGMVLHPCNCGLGVLVLGLSALPITHR